MRLLCHQWKQGAIPGDNARQAIIGRVTSRQMKMIWKNTLCSKYEPHPSVDGFLIQPRLERVREEASEHSRLQSERGKIGAEKRWRKHSASNGVSISASIPNATAQAMPEGMLADSTPISNSIPTPSVDKSTSVVGSSTPKKNTSDAEWASKLRTDVYAIGDRKIKSLTPAERILAARYHCLTFANCTKSEANNKAKASQVAAGFASMSRNETYGELTVRQYFTAGHDLHEQREKTPWYDPWLIRSVLEFK